MPHIPEFPPKSNEWRPGRFPAPPLPRWALNPSPEWLPPALREEITTESGYWAMKRAEAMVPSGTNGESVRRMARGMWGRLREALPPAPAPVAPTPTPARRGRRK